jgi:hypothetical protein
MIEFAAALSLALVISGVMAFCAVAFVRTCVTSTGSDSMAIVIALVVAILFSIPVSLWLLENSPLHSINWGHAGAGFYLGYVIGSFIVFVTAVLKARRSPEKLPPNHSVETDAS